MPREIPLFNPAIDEKDCQAVLRVMRSGWLVLQQETEKFETAFAQYLGTKHAVLTSSFTNSLYLSLIIAGITPGDEVITTTLASVDSVKPIMNCGAKPVLVDLEPETGLLSIEQVASAITERTKAIIVVHLYGQMVDMKSFKQLADQHNLLLIENAAHATEAAREGIQPGQLGFSTCFSFHLGNNITAGTGGAIATNDDFVAERAKSLKYNDLSKIDHVRRMPELNNNSLATDFQATILRSQLGRIEPMWQRRKELYERYAQAFTELGIAFNQVAPNSRHAYQRIVVWVNPARRDFMREMLLAQGIETSIHYEPIHLKPFYREKFGFCQGNFPLAERLGAATITLPLYPSLSNEQQDYIIEKLSQLILIQENPRENVWLTSF